MKNYYYYWAKTSKDSPALHLLPYHSLDVAACTKLLLKGVPIWRKKLEPLGDAVPCRAAIRDMGKMSKHFQGWAPEALKRLGKKPWKTPRQVSPRHDVSLQQLFEGGFLDILEENGVLSCDDPYLLECLMVSITGHHGYPSTTHK